jgi:hypothetical protein
LIISERAFKVHALEASRPTAVKIPIIRAAVHATLADVLITDEKAALGLLG